MIDVRETDTFANWLSGLKDEKAKARVASRLRGLEMGNPGDVAPVGEGVTEMRIHYGPGYRVYYEQRGPAHAVILCGGDKSTQRADIK